MKKLEFGPSKCHSIHIGKHKTCYPLKAHETVIKEKDSAVYLGDTILNTGSNNKTIESRRNLGIGAISQIFSLVEEKSFGHFYFDILSILRDSVLVSKLVFNSEIWYNLTKDNIRKLEEIDEIFWRKAYEVCRSVAKESLYIISGKMPLMYIILKRRLLYWWHLCHVKEDELIRKVYSVQCATVQKSDWVYTLKQDCESLNIQISDEQVACMSKSKFKNYIESKIMNKASIFLNNLKDSHSKSKYLPKFNGKPDAFLLSKKLSKDEKIVLYKLKTRMINVAGNFPSSKQTKWCKLCFVCYDQQEHLINCFVIRKQLENKVDFSLQYCDIEGPLARQENLAKIYTVILSTREEILKDNSPNGDQALEDRSLPLP